MDDPLMASYYAAPDKQLYLDTHPEFAARHPELVAQVSPNTPGSTGYSDTRNPAPEATPTQPTADPNAPIDFVGYNEQGNWQNNKFAKSRNVADLQAEDIWGYKAFTDKYGPAWMRTSEANRREIANELLEKGMITEGRGQIAILSDPEFDDKVKGKIGGEEIVEEPVDDLTDTHPIGGTS